ncbi:AhpC/TSA family protein [Alteromonas sediminis]|uniref:thioredoxin-dependent peroxiredoxin n=1 Tax=Alteromonas sediminis TaxID=2259342 RepID=A0A3N5Z560_9ALTE|nr:peroxiredoxin-like family protein [Alteromonas sediminis]RPJ65374.1 AhpC/TSA family protein [Alteromonas sediminis]
MKTRYLSYFLLSLSLFTATSWALDRTQLAQSADAVTPLLDGQSIPNVTVALADGSPVSLRGLAMQKPSIVLFYRGGWCPYCSRQLAGLKNIESQLVELGYQVLAVSPESPAKLQEQKLQTEFAVTLISDSALSAIKGFGVGFKVDDETVQKYTGFGISLTKDESGASVLPAPSIFIIDTMGVVRFSYVNPDFKARPSEQLILAAATALK